jgi:DNA repair ATPase RecN
MKGIAMLLILINFCGSEITFAQSEEAQQLLLNIEKLAQFKQILKDLKQGYEILSSGYNAIRNISEGNFDLHKTFLDGLLAVSPEVKKYTKVSDIIKMQLKIVNEYKNAFKRFKNNGHFTSEEIDYLSQTYNNLFKKSLNDLDELATVLTAGKLRMSDDERLHFIDNVFENMQDKLIFLKHFNSSASILAIQREREQSDIDIMRKLYDVE